LAHILVGDVFAVTFESTYPVLVCMWCIADISPPSQQAGADPFADFLSSTTSLAAPSQTAAPAGSEMFGSAPVAAAAQTNPSTKDAIMALYGNSAMASGPYGMPSAGVCNLQNRITVLFECHSTEF